MTEDHLALRPEIERLISQHDWPGVAELLRDWQHPESAELLWHLEKGDRVLLFRSFTRRRAANVFAHLDYDDQDEFLKELSAEDTRNLLANLKPDDRTSFFEELPAEVTQRLFKLLSPEDLAEARELLGYPEESVGRLMTPDYVEVRPNMTVAEALAHIRKTGRDSETFNQIYVTDENGNLLDGLRVRRLIMADPSVAIESIMDRKFVALSAFDDREIAVQIIQRYDLYALPVVDSDGVLLGIVTMDDVLDVAEAEATEDFHKSAGVMPLESPYSQATAAFLYRKRVGWLTILIGVNLISAKIIDRYEAYLNEYFVLFFFAPLLIASGGNTGAQSATLMVRGLATGDLDINRWGKSFGKEIVVGLMLGLTTGFLTFLLGIYRGGISIGLVVGFSMIAIVMAANLIGVVLPFALTKAKLDPAVASSPLITSLMDAIGLLIYFGIASLFLELTF